MEGKYVYVIYDPLYERTVCVHDEPEKECEICEPIRKERDAEYNDREVNINTNSIGYTDIE